MKRIVLDGTCSNLLFFFSFLSSLLRASVASTGLGGVRVSAGSLLDLSITRLLLNVEDDISIQGP